MENLSGAMMKLIANEVCEKEIDKTQFDFSDDDLKRLYCLSKSHDLAHLVGDALIKNNLISNGEIKSKFEKQIMTAVYRYENINYELNRLKQVINEAEIPFICLKGSVIRQYYPEPWMRTSCDIDILIADSDVEKAKKVLAEELNYTYVSEWNYEVSFYTPAKTHIELHHILNDENKVIDKVLSTVWKRSAPITNGSFHYEMSDEMYYFYHIAHMAKHFVKGGCGIRPFIDIWVLNHKCEFDKQKRYEILDEAGLLQFAKAAEQLSEAWISNEPHTPLSEQLEHFILSGGTYGTVENRVAVQQIKKGGKLKYALFKIWLPYDVLKFTYPSLEGKKILLPFYEIRRWGKLLFKGGVKRSINELSINSSTTPDKQAQISALLCDLGLHDNK